MKFVFTLISLLVLFLSSLSCYAFDPKYTVHTSKKDIEFKKKRATDWYEANVTNKKFYFYDTNKHISWLKDKALRWHTAQITQGKFYFVHSDKELQFTKDKALRWFEHNSQ